MTKSIHDNLAKQRAANTAAAALLPDPDLSTLMEPLPLSAHQVSQQLEPKKAELNLHSAKELRPTEVPYGLDAKFFLEGMRRKAVGDLKGAIEAYDKARSSPEV